MPTSNIFKHAKLPPPKFIFYRRSFGHLKKCIFSKIKKILPSKALCYQNTKISLVKIVYLACTQNNNLQTAHFENMRFRSFLKYNCHFTKPNSVVVEM